MIGILRIQECGEVESARLAASLADHRIETGLHPEAGIRNPGKVRNRISVLVQIGEFILQVPVHPIEGSAWNVLE